MDHSLFTAKALAKLSEATSHAMLQSMRSQRVRHDLATQQQQHYTQRQNTGWRIHETWRNNQPKSNQQELI